MKALLILAHGSRKKESNDEVVKLAESLDRTENSGFGKVLCAFNQFSEPSAERQIDILAGLGATHITILPYFIAGGSHVTEDIPRLADEARQNHPGIDFKVTAHLGAFEGVKDLIMREVGV